MNLSRLFLSALAVFFFIFLFDWVLHGMLLTETYRMTPQLWRPEKEMMAMMPYSVLFQFGYSLILTYIFSTNYEGRGLGEGLRFGLAIGLLLGVTAAMSICWMPISVGLACAWFAGGLAHGVGAGVILSKVYS